MHHNLGHSSSCMALKWLLASSAALPTNNGLIGTRGHHFAPFAGIDTLISPSHFYTAWPPGYDYGVKILGNHSVENIFRFQTLFSA